MRFTRSYPPIFLSILILSILLGGVVQIGQAVRFPEVTTYYTISGEMCHGEIGYSEVYSVHGELCVTLTPLTASSVYFKSVMHEVNVETGIVLENETNEGILINREAPDGNYTLYYADVPSSSTQRITTLYHTVEAAYQGARYVQINGMYVKAHYFLHVVTDLQSVFRCEWFFEWETGILLQFTKSIEMNFIRVQWIDYKVKSTTLSLTGSHPITAFFTNHRETFYAVVGAAVAVLLLFIYLVQKKSNGLMSKNV